MLKKSSPAGQLFCRCIPSPSESLHVGVLTTSNISHRSERSTISPNENAKAIAIASNA